jgi:hypothetical protein
MNVVKLFHNYWHTVSRHIKFYGGDRPCCFCKETKEDWRHILNCPTLDASYHRDANVATPGRLLDSFGKGTSTPITRYKIINEPTITFPNLR